MVKRRIAELDQAGVAQDEIAAMVDLRFDRVVIGLIAGVRNAVEDTIPGTHWVMFATTAPIRKASKVEAFVVSAIRAQLAADVAPAERVETFEGNDLRIRLLPDRPAKAPRLMGFVHNPTPRSGEFLDAVQRAFQRG